MAGVEISNPCKRRFFVVDEDGPADNVTVREVSIHESGALQESKTDADVLREWVIAHSTCPCIPRSQAESSLAQKVEELARSNRDLEQFAYVASHDLQEPLRMVAAYTQLLAERYRGQLDEKADQYLAYATEGALRMQSLVQDLLTYSRVDRTNNDCPVDCNSLLQEVLRNLGTAIEEAGARITAGTLPTIHADRSQLVQLFQNLIGNGIKFRAERAPSIVIDAQSEGRFWLFSVADNGIGVAPEFRESIFGVFRRLHTRIEYPGNGIGLAVCKKVVEQYGGDIWVESQVGQGATFKFTLPAGGSCADGSVCQ